MRPATGPTCDRPPLFGPNPHRGSANQPSPAPARFSPFKAALRSSSGLLPPNHCITKIFALTEFMPPIYHGGLHTRRNAIGVDRSRSAPPSQRRRSPQTLTPSHQSRLCRIWRKHTAIGTGVLHAGSCTDPDPTSSVSSFMSSGSVVMYGRAPAVATTFQAFSSSIVFVNKRACACARAPHARTHACHP
jgi:hypothetical protein